MSLILNGTDGLSDVDGSAATPAIRGTDANTGIFFPAADTVAISEGGVESVRFDSNGNSLFGTTTNTNSSRIVSNGVIESTTGGVRFPDGTTQTTAAVPASTNLDGIGSYAVLRLAINSNLATGATVAGSSLRYDGSTNTSNVDLGNPFFGGVWQGDWNNFSYNGGGTALSGTWRKMSSGNTYRSYPDGKGSFAPQWGVALFVRIS